MVFSAQLQPPSPVSQHNPATLGQFQARQPLPLGSFRAGQAPWVAHSASQPASQPSVEAERWELLLSVGVCAPPPAARPAQYISIQGFEDKRAFGLDGSIHDHFKRPIVFSVALHACWPAGRSSLALARA